MRGRPIIPPPHRLVITTMTQSAKPILRHSDPRGATHSVGWPVIDAMWS